MNCLLYSWDAYGERNLVNGLEEKGYKVEMYRRKINNHLQDDCFQEELEKMILGTKNQFVISFNFFPLISEVCSKLNTIYIAWIFSSPHYSLYCDSVFNDINYIFCFDQIQCLALKQSGASHVYHLPLAANIGMLERAQKAATDIPANKVSFVGTLYTDEHNYFDQIQDMPAYIRGYLEGVCQAQLKIYGYNLIKDVVNDTILETLKSVVNYKMEDNYFLGFGQFVENMIHKKVTIMERSQILKAIAKEIPLDLYTGSQGFVVPNIKNRGYIDYYSTMPGVFYKSKVNLNITLRSIETGIPLRVVDILSCKGFLLTNYQEEIAQHYIEGEEVVMFGSVEEAVEKCKFYLNHEKERIKIAEKGYQKVMHTFSYDKQLTKMFEVL